MKMLKHKKELFRLAWTYAREGAKRFGGKVKSYFAESLKLAWQVCRVMYGADKKEIRLPKLPQLQGSPKQIAWAESLREKSLNMVIDYLEKTMKSVVNKREENLKAAKNILKWHAEHTESKYWIETRYSCASEVVHAAALELGI